MTIYRPSKFFKFTLKNVKSVDRACKLLKSQFKMPWGSSKIIFHQFIIFSLPDEVGENKIYQLLGFSVYFWKLWLRQGGLSFYTSQRGDEGADTDLMFQFCLPNTVQRLVDENTILCIESLGDIDSKLKVCYL